MPRTPSKPSTPPAAAPSTIASVFALAAGLFLTLTLVKWGNPVILDNKIEPPKDLLEVLYMSWPTHWAFWMLPVLCVLAILSARSGASAPKPAGTTARSPLFTLMFWLPAIWLGWQCVSATQTVDPTLTALTVRHFAVCVMLFYTGCFALREERNNRLVWICLILGLVVVLRSGLEQHFGGLAEVKRFFYSQPNWRDYPPEFIQKVNKQRIYATFCYPNSLAGALLLLLPVSLTALWIGLARFGILRLLTVSALGLAGAACMIWSESKAGWLLALGLGLVVFGHLSLPKRVKWGIIGGIAVLGLVAFGLRYAGFFEKGATSVVARFDYWKAAAQTFRDHPVLGSGPGTFYVEYMKRKAPESEVTRLCHNDFLEQASDSGLIGFLAFGGFVVLALIGGHRVIRSAKTFDPILFSVWLGLLGLSLHSLVDFHLYIPGLAWLAFFLFGWLCARIRQGTGLLQG